MLKHQCKNNCREVSRKAWLRFNRNLRRVGKACDMRHGGHRFKACFQLHSEGNFVPYIYARGERSHIIFTLYLKGFSLKIMTIIFDINNNYILLNNCHQFN